MTNTPTVPPRGTVPPARAPRRLSRQARLEQLVAAAMPVVARDGFFEFSLDEIAERAGVTRNLLYHYFPEGRPDVVLAVVERAGHELVDGWVVDEGLPLERRVDENNARMVAHALEGTDAWRIHRHARGATSPEVRARVDHFVGIVIASIARNHLGTSDPPPLARLVLQGYFAFFETVIDDWRATTLPAEQIVQLLGETLSAAIRAATHRTT